MWLTLYLTSLGAISILSWQKQATPPHNQVMDIPAFLQMIFSKVCSLMEPTPKSPLLNSAAL